MSEEKYESQSESVKKAVEEIMEDQEYEGAVYVHADHNPDDVPVFYEVPSALAEAIQPKGDRRTFVECLAALIDVS